VEAIWDRAMLEDLLPRREHQRGSSTLGDLDAALPGIIRRMLASSRTMALVIELEPGPGRYVQIQTDPDDESIIAECVSNEFLTGDLRLTIRQEEALPGIGWEWPAPPNQPNWRTKAYEPGAVIDMTALLLHTLRRFFGCTETSILSFDLYQGIGPSDPPPTQ
jgi:hypothetical protein